MSDSSSSSSCSSPVVDDGTAPLPPLKRRRRGSRCLDGEKRVQSRSSLLTDLSGGETFRLDHTIGNNHNSDEEQRILIYSNQRAGAIAKIIYSTHDNNTAKINVLECKPNYRGQDLGGLLFSQAINYIQKQQEEASSNSKSRHDEDYDDSSSSSSSTTSSMICCQLDAEEDGRRYNKLVDFYQSLGCGIKRNAKIQFINNNDGETYRKVPMLMQIPKLRTEGNRNPNDDQSNVSSLLQTNCTFLPVHLLLQRNGQRAVASAHSSNETNDHHHCRRPDHWLLLQGNDNKNSWIEVRTTTGDCLQIDESGNNCCTTRMMTTSASGATSNNTNSIKFELVRIPDSGDDDEEEDHDDDSKKGHVINRNTTTCLWMIRSVQYGNKYLAMDEENCSLQLRQTPSFWQVVQKQQLPTSSSSSSQTSLVCCNSYNTPLRRHHFWQQYKLQSVEYAENMKLRYACYHLGHMTVWQALELATHLPADPFAVRSLTADDDSNNRQVSLRTRCFQLAEAFRHMGHPDWIQLLGLMYSLGSVVKLLEGRATAAAAPAASDREDGSNDDEDDVDQYDWTHCVRSRVLGCPVVEGTEFSEFRSLCPDLDRYNNTNHDSITTGKYQAHCGLDNVLLTWSGPEYMYHMLRHNQVRIPEEGLQVLRLASLSDWHTKKLNGGLSSESNCYTDLVNDRDRDVQALVADFDAVLWSVSHDSRSSTAGDCGDNEYDYCEQLWRSHYADIASKYHADQELDW